jgi:tRNA G26 N,N-dimethylase Trm1
MDQQRTPSISSNWPIPPFVPNKHAQADSALLPTLRTLQQEADPRLPPFYLHTHELAKRAGVSPPPKRLIFEELRRGGFLARRTHIEKFGLKTDADAAVCVAATQRAAAAAETAAAARREKRAKKARQEKQKQAKPVAKRKKKGDRGRPWGTQKEKPI